MIYRRKAHYHETDQMGVIHHSNYIKWFEEARIHMMDQIGVSYREMEEAGIISPVLGIQCEYKNMVTFDEEVYIHVAVKEYNGIKLVIEYQVKDDSGTKLYTTGESKHCFLNRDRKIISLKKTAPAMHAKFEGR
ncbi:MAG: acyl-CoA thioesterase [Vallitaleaceae bacterium]|nr:acyl-CoA thioesterase [Vallitaleaceae bacterium]